MRNRIRCLIEDVLTHCPRVGPCSSAMMANPDQAARATTRSSCPSMPRTSKSTCKAWGKTCKSEMLAHDCTWLALHLRRIVKHLHRSKV